MQYALNNAIQAGVESETYRPLPLCTMASSSTHQLRTFSTPNWSTIVWTWLTLSTTCQSFPNCRPFKATTQLRNLYCFIQKFFLFSNSQKSLFSLLWLCGCKLPMLLYPLFLRQNNELAKQPKKYQRRLLRYKRVFFFFFMIFFESIRRRRDDVAVSHWLLKNLFENHSFVEDLKGRVAKRRPESSTISSCKVVTFSQDYFSPIPIAIKMQSEGDSPVMDLHIALTSRIATVLSPWNLTWLQ